MKGEKVNACLDEYRDWCAKIGICRVSDVNRLITEGKTNKLINLSEIWQEQKISEIAYKIKRDINSRRVVFISGPSSSGKTSFATRLSFHLRVLGVEALPVSLDDYYYDRSRIPRDLSGKYDLETIEAIDYRSFNSHLEDLLNGRTVKLPVFDFKTAAPSPKTKTATLLNDEIILVEGIHALNDKIASNIQNDQKLRIYCTALTALCTDEGKRIKSRSTRLIRRLVRDSFFRNSPAEYTLEQWKYVEAGAEKYVYPFTDSADIIFNSSILYEQCVLKSYLNEILFDLRFDERTVDLLQIVNSFKLIDRDKVPTTSFVREFIGGSTLINN